MAVTGNLIGRGQPDPLTVSGRSPAVLALHGFGGTPGEVALVVELAAQLGLAARAPLLPGHGTHVADLARRRFDDWQRAAEAELQSLQAAHSQVIVAGLSMGALLGIDLAARFPGRVQALILLCPAVRLCRPFPDWGLLLVEKLRIRDFWMPKRGPDLGDPIERRHHLTYDAQPVHAAIAVRNAGARALEQLGDVHCPLFVAHGRHDRVCPVSNARLVYDLAGSGEKRLRILPHSRHIVTRDVDRPLLRGELLEFLRENSQPR